MMAIIFPLARQYRRPGYLALPGDRHQPHPLLDRCIHRCIAILFASSSCAMEWICLKCYVISTGAATR